MSSTTADQNSTFVARTRSGLRRVQLGERGALELLGDLEPRRAEIHRRAPQQARSRILGPVDPVAEAHQPVAGVEQVLDVVLDRVGGRGAVEHRQHARRGAAVERPREGADRRRERRAAVGAGRGDDPGGERGGVEPVLGGADPVRVDRLDVLRVGLAAPLEQEARGRGRAGRDEIRVDGRRLAVGDAGRLRDDRDHRGREAREVGARLLVGDVDQLARGPTRRRGGR